MELKIYVVSSKIFESYTRRKDNIDAYYTYPMEGVDIKYIISNVLNSPLNSVLWTGRHFIKNLHEANLLCSCEQSPLLIEDYTLGGLEIFHYKQYVYNKEER